MGYCNITTTLWKPVIVLIRGNKQTVLKKYTKGRRHLESAKLFPVQKSSPALAINRLCRMQYSS